MDRPADIPDATLTAFGVRAPVLVERTGIATVWKVVRPDGTPAALKLYHDGDMKNEGPGVVFLSALQGKGAAEVYDRRPGEVLLEWLDGPSLGDLTRRGQDAEANDALIEVACIIHAKRREVTGDLPLLSDWFGALFEIRLDSGLPDGAVRDMEFAKVVARRLISDQIDVRPLHGDLHHDNIRMGTRGYCAFDAKGVLGERAYELANAFRNPKGAADIVQSPERVRSLATRWGAAFGVARTRLLDWAMVKIALSMSWRSGTVLRDDPELGFLSMVRQIASEG